MKDEVARDALKHLVNKLESEGSLSPKRAKEVTEILEKDD